ncbi:tRNA lysidine(34) synthetase TilS [Buchnera aphidicola]|uniref:tRNA(Ile)-lysidine synthase n=1 Tax=Buchnera aphidicola str. Ua (Uroleucon ambrosiae) TaxID=1005057 RepID=G2LNZ4_BUCUM|nr:tRNA lysidine(34) synthetase TilS [Buchnera aphidicola]AEO07931.1 cell cycle protein MesJ [Buchnera aphidicola str. Ua (Uroleucon ambrosiae)]
MIDKIIKNYQNKSFLIAYSGGLDSTVLLYQLLKIKKNNIQIRAIHINHNIHSLSQQWTEHCQKICVKNQIPLIIEYLQPHKNMNNLEERLRIQRYNIFYKNLLKNEILLTGHHINDQCETFILSLKRGSGPTGLSCMSFQTSLGNNIIIRPFLNITKKELELWAKKHQLKWIEDISNLQIHYDRNFIRHNVMPILEKKWPYFIQNCLRTINICQKETKLLNYFLHKKIYNLIIFNDCLNIKTFKNMQKDMCTALIRYWLSLKKIKLPSYKSIQYIYDQIIFSRQDANPRIVLKKNEIRRYKETLYFLKIQPSVQNTILFWHNHNIKLKLPNNLGYLEKNKYGNKLPAPHKNELINIRFQYEGKIFILGRHKKRQIKKIWQENNIPPWLRNQIPLLFYNNIFIAALGIFIVNCNMTYRDDWMLSWNNHVKLPNNYLFSFF